MQDELDLYAKFHDDFPPSSIRPRGSLYITDRSMDLFAPLVHEFTYQAMAHDLLPIMEGHKVTYRTVINEGRPDQEEKDIPISEKDKIWVENRHRHMKDVIEKLMADFKRFVQDNPNFTQQAGDNSNSLNAIKDMMAGLPQFQELKEAYALHLGMAQESMNRFQRFKLGDLSAVEQVCSLWFHRPFFTDAARFAPPGWMRITRNRKASRIKWYVSWTWMKLFRRIVSGYSFSIFFSGTAFTSPIFRSCWRMLESLPKTVKS